MNTSSNANNLLKGKNMKKCIIVGAGEFFYSPKEIIEENNNRLIIAADGGYNHCVKHGIKPDAVIGDFDSLGGKPENCVLVCLPTEKDDTDTLAAIRYAIEENCGEFHIFGGTGGRFDHTFANMQCLVFLSKQKKQGFLHGDGYVITAVTNGAICFSENASGSVSVFAAGDKAEGVCETGLKYSLKNAVVKNDFPIGVSNSFTGRKSRISVEKGSIFVIFPKGVKYTYDI